MMFEDEFVFTFYGDDFTGSTDVMEVLEWGGVPTALFLEPPTPEIVRREFPDVRAVGVAGVSRTMSPAQMDEALPPAFQAMQALKAPFFHYKVCSTFDSSPTMGSIGRATEIGMGVFGSPMVPMMVGAPELRRYVAFSNLFARVDDVTYRLDRHPTMSKHPITPMTESDLRLHLSAQTDLRIAALNVLHMERSPAEVDAYFSALVADGAQVILFDSINRDHLSTIGRIIWGLRSDQPTFLVGSSGFQYALTQYWNDSGVVERPAARPSPGPVDQLIVISGSAAPPTAEQITWALENGFQGLRLDSVGLVDPERAESVRAATVEAALALLGQHDHVLLYSAHGPDDPAISATKAELERSGLGAARVGALLGKQQGLILRELLEATGLRRAVVCGGDTCGYASSQLGIFALRAMIPVAPGAPLCRAYSHNERFNGLEIALKAGQVGKPDYFASIARGSTTQ
ncbi:MAG: four-carbon acid sugar kinase family protein [Chloroflexi bacterium]|nr:four-carbon acid sugar kinase family protein [Chloroflexota bacterium]